MSQIHADQMRHVHKKYSKVLFQMILLKESVSICVLWNVIELFLILKHPLANFLVTHYLIASNQIQD